MGVGPLAGWRECVQRGQIRESGQECAAQERGRWALTKSKEDVYSPPAHSSRSLDFEHTIVCRGGLLECIPIGKSQGDLLSFQRHVRIQSYWIDDGWTEINSNKWNMECRRLPHEVWYVDENFISELPHHSVVYNQPETTNQGRDPRNVFLQSNVSQ